MSHLLSAETETDDKYEDGEALTLSLALHSGWHGRKNSFSEVKCILGTEKLQLHAGLVN